MIRSIAIFVMALPGTAQGQTWETTTTFVPVLDAPVVTTGEIIGPQHDVDGVAWLSSEIVTRDNSEPLDCALNANLELNHFYGVDGVYTLDIFGHFGRSDDGMWSLDPLEFYLDMPDPEATYLGEDIVLTVETFDCLNAEAAITLAYAATFKLEEGTGPDQIAMTGTTRMTLPITRFIPFQ